MQHNLSFSKGERSKYSLVKSNKLIVVIIFPHALQNLLDKPEAFSVPFSLHRIPHKELSDFSRDSFEMTWSCFGFLSVRSSKKTDAHQS